jgi:cytochrome c556
LVVFPTVLHADPQDDIDYRQHVMKILGAQLDAIQLILQKKVPADSLVAHTQILADTAAMSKRAFKPDVPGGKAKPDVWTNWTDFSKRLDEFAADTAALARAAQAGGVGAVAPKLKASIADCQSCHENYETPEKK